MIRIADWFRYEVNKHGGQAKEGHELRAGDLDYIRRKVRGYAINRGFAKLLNVAKLSKVWEVIGIFDRLLDLAGAGDAAYRGVIREQRNGEPATPEDLVEILPATPKQISFALSCLSHPSVSWILIDESGFPENSGVSQINGNLPPNTIQVNTIQINTNTEKHLDFVFLSEEEYQKLVERFGEKEAKEKIADLNAYIGKIGEAKAQKKYNSHYFTILSWDRKNAKERGNNVKNRNSRDNRRNFEEQESQYGSTI